MAWEATAVGPRLRARGHEGRLVRAAAAGESEAFAALYRRYEARVFNLASRITGSEDEAADATRAAFLEVLRRLPATADGERLFGTHLLTAACTAGYAAIENRRGAGMEDDGEPLDNGGGEEEVEDSDGFSDSPLLDVWRDEIQAANARLPARQREVLALLELGGLSYADVAQVMEIGPESVAQLVAAARLELHDELRGTDLAAEPLPTEDCEGALQLMAMRDDAELASASDDDEWLIGHLAGCRDCRAYLDAMQEARLSYSAWEPEGPPASLFRETMAGAAAILAQSAPAAESRREPAAAPSAGIAAVPGEPADERGRSDGVTQVLPPAASADERRLRHRREVLLAGGWGAALLLGVLALLAGGVFDTAEGEDKAAEATLQPPTPAPSPAAAERPAQERRATRRETKRERPSPPVPVVGQPTRAAPVVVVAPPAPQRRRATPRRRARRPRAEQPPAPPPTTTPAPQQQAPEPNPAPGGTPPSPTPGPERPAAAECLNPGGQPVPC